MKPVILEELIPDVHGNITFTSNTVNANTNDFKINETAIEEELANVVAKIAYYGDIHSQAQAQLSRKEEQVKYVYHKISTEIRQSVEKLTENGIKDRVMVHPDYQYALAELNQIEESAKRAEVWWRTIQEKANILRTISNRQMTELRVSPY